MVALVTDDFIDFGASDLLIPGISQWEPIAAAMGVMAFYSLMIVSLSFYFKRWIGHQTWRMIHYLGFGGFLSALIHGVTGGTDRGHSAVMAMYVTSAALVLGLLAVRLLASHSVENAAQAAPQRPVHESKSS
jgi:predicted ferric reductase